MLNHHPNKKKNKIEVSQLLVGLICAFGMLMTIFYYVTLWNGFECDPSVAVAGITEIVASVLGYLIYQAKLKDSRNKYKVDKNGVPYFMNDATTRYEPCDEECSCDNSENSDENPVD